MFSLFLLVGNILADPPPYEELWPAEIIAEYYDSHPEIIKPPDQSGIPEKVTKTVVAKIN